MLERFMDLFLNQGPEDILDPIRELKPFGRCRVERVVEIERANRIAVVLNWDYLTDHKADMIVYAKEGRYKKGGWVQVIEARRSDDKNDERFIAQYLGPLRKEISVICHQYFARPMKTERDIWREDQLNSSRQKSLRDLDPVIVART